MADLSVRAMVAARVGHLAALTAELRAAWMVAWKVDSMAALWAEPLAARMAERMVGMKAGH